MYNDGNAFKITCRTMRRRDRHAHRRQLLRLLQEGSEDADQLRGQSVRQGRGRTRRRRAGVSPATASARSSRSTGAIIDEGQTFAGCLKMLGDSVDRSCRGIRDRQEVPDSSTCRRTCRSICQRSRCELDERRQDAIDQAAAGHDLHHPDRLQDPAGKASRRTVLAADRHAGRRDVLPQALHGIGGGKSEISKSIADSMVYGPIYVADLETDLDQVEEIFERDYSDRFLPHFRPDYIESRFAADPAARSGRWDR